MSTEWLFYNIFRNLKVFLLHSDTYFSKNTYILTQPKHREAAMPPLDTTMPPSLLSPFFWWTKQSWISSWTAQGTSRPAVLVQPQAQLAVAGASSSGRGALGELCRQHSHGCVPLGVSLKPEVWESSLSKKLLYKTALYLSYPLIHIYIFQDNF